MNIEKPKIGEPCNGCGICCQIQVCRNGAFVLGLVNELGDTVEGPCPALTPHQGKLMCGIVLTPNKYIKGSKYPAKVLSKHFKKLIGAGNFCDDLGYDEDPEENEKMLRIYDEWSSDEDLIAEKMKSMKIIHGK